MIVISLLSACVTNRYCKPYKGYKPYSAMKSNNLWRYKF